MTIFNFLGSLIQRSGEKREILVKFSLILGYSLIRYKYSKGKAYSTLRKKLYSQIVSKNIDILVDPDYH